MDNTTLNAIALSYTSLVLRQRSGKFDDLANINQISYGKDNKRNVV